MEVSKVITNAAVAGVRGKRQ